MLLTSKMDTGAYLIVFLSYLIVTYWNNIRVSNDSDYNDHFWM